MIEPQPRYGTKKATEELALELSLPYDEWMQDWPYEVVDPNDIERYISHYKQLNDEDKKFLLMEGIIQAATEQDKNADFIKYWTEIKVFLKENFKIHEYTVFYWSCFDSGNLDECWAITPYMRELWCENSVN